MNALIAQYFDEIETRLIASPVIVSYRVLRREIVLSDGKLRVKATLNNGGTAELFEYVAETGGQITTSKYSFHWQDADGNLVTRWDNAPHHKELLNAPFHLHEAGGAVQATPGAMSIVMVIEEIEKAFSS
jgi:hypothetical protein